jgi:lambda family phage tail tape measure protein
VQRAFDHGLTSLDNYFAARKDTITKAAAQEVAALKASRDAMAKIQPATEVERVKLKSDISDKNNQIKLTEITTTEKLNALDIERVNLAQTLANSVADAEARMREARGQTSAVAKQKLDEDVRNYAEALGKIGKLSADQQAKAVSEFRVTLTLDVDAKANQEKIDQLFGEIDRKRQQLDQDVSLGIISQGAAERQLAEFEAARLPIMQSLADEAERLATALDNPDLMAKAAELQIKLKALGTTVSESARLAASFGTDTLNAVEGDLSNFLGSTISQVNSVGEAFAALATSVVASIQQIVAHLIAAKIVETIARTLLGFAGSATAVAVPSPGDVNAGIVKGVKGFASGGFTGPGGKYQPAGVVHKGEFVFPQEAVRRIGVRQLYDLAGLRTPRVRPLRAPRHGYADGGLVTASVPVGGGGTISGTLHLEVDEGVIVRAASAHLASPDGQKQVLDVAVRHKSKLGSILR